MLYIIYYIVMYKSSCITRKKFPLPSSLYNSLVFWWYHYQILILCNTFNSVIYSFIHLPSHWQIRLKAMGGDQYYFSLLETLPTKKKNNAFAINKTKMTVRVLNTSSWCTEFFLAQNNVRNKQQVLQKACTSYQ